MRLLRNSARLAVYLLLFPFVVGGIIFFALVDELAYGLRHVEAPSWMRMEE